MWGAAYSQRTAFAAANMGDGSLLPFLLILSWREGDGDGDCFSNVTGR